MEQLKAEIALKRKEALAQGASQGRSKFMRRGDTAAMAPSASAPASNDDDNYAASSSKGRAATTASDPSAPLLGDSLAAPKRISEKELVARLRAKGVPIRLFAEDYEHRLQRLKLLESSEERSEGQLNDFKQLLAKADSRLAEGLLEKKAGTENKEEARKRDLQALLEKVDTSDLGPKLLAKDPEKTRYLVGVYFKKILLIWERTLNERDDHESASTQGRLALATRAQSAEYLKPFFVQLKRGTIEADVLARVTEICMHMQDREYLKANDAYLRLSIGNAPWPIGVTMVGIHERSGREKIASSNVAHGLNDETQRKWIQSIKRMMTFAQSIYPPDDLGKAIG
ncbi:mRNA splicing protein prp18 [Podochytrium sp. JEL0797]|nr:mRNA splicing protein prp18 [Podochytrium sp. JEL0797]